MRRSILAAGLAVCVVLTVSSPAIAYERIGSDPNESTDFGGNIIRDIRSSILRVEPRENGRVVILVVRSYERFGDGWVITVRMDSRESDAYDRVMIMHPDFSKESPADCSVFTRAGYSRGERLAKGLFRLHGKAIRCRVPIRFFEPTRTIRWSVLSEEAGDPSAGSDRAPDRGHFG